MCLGSLGLIRLNRCRLGDEQAGVGRPPVRLLRPAGLDPLRHQSHDHACHNVKPNELAVHASSALSTGGCHASRRPFHFFARPSTDRQNSPDPDRARQRSLRRWSSNPPEQTLSLSRKNDPSTPVRDAFTGHRMKTGSFGSLSLPMVYRWAVTVALPKDLASVSSPKTDDSPLADPAHSR